MERRNLLALGLATASASACIDDAGRGSLTVILESEDTIVNGLDPGDDVEDVRDGWQLRFEKFIATIGHVEVHHATKTGLAAHDEDVYVVDLRSVPASGLPLWEIPDLRVGRWEFEYDVTGAADGAIRHASVSSADYDAMRAVDASYLIAGDLHRDDGRSCPPPALATPGAATPAGTNAAGHACYANPTVSFELLVPTETHYGPCELDGVPGFSISDGSTQAVAATIHGDHLAFNGFPEGDEGGVLRLLQWLADCDLDVDGVVTRAELEAIAPSALAELDARYQLGGSPITPLTSMWDYLSAQLETQGHMNGEGECPADGSSHEH